MGEIRVPKSLLPENIMATVEQKIMKEKIKKKRRKKAAISTVCAAAAVALMIGAYFRFFNKNYGEAEGEISGLNRIKSYQALYNYLRKDISIIMNNVTEGDGVPKGDGTLSTDYSYSETNIQTQGIDEGDIVKTDGDYIYVTKGNNIIEIIKADGESTRKVSDIDIRYNILKEYYKNDKIDKYSLCIVDTYIYKDRLVAIATGTEEKEMVYVAVAELNEGEAGNVHIMRQEGDYYDSRMKDGILYLITDKYMAQDLLESVDDVIGSAGDKEILPEDVFYTSIDKYYNRYYIMSSVDIMSEAELTDSKAYIGKGIELYVSSDHIYFFDMGSSYVSEINGSKTNIVSFSFESGKITPKSSGSVYGVVADSFSADEYNGYLRVVTTGVLGNNLYVLNENLETVGSITGLAEGEYIKSARFLGDTGYFVTYRNTDPLFTVDLSNPESPKLTDELKLTGYSAYLHFMDEDNLLGIGYESDPDTGVEKWIKVTLFDVADKSDVKVKANLEYKENIYSDVISNHNAMLASRSKGLYGFCLYQYYGYGLEYQYKVFLYKDGDIKEVETIKKYKDGVGYTVRGLYIGDYFYVADESNMYVYSLDEVISEEEAAELLSISY